VELQSEKVAPLFADIESPADAVVAARLRAGDLESFETIVRRYSGGLLAAARRMLGNDHDAQDAVQEAFSSALKAIATFRGDASISTWLHRIVVNAALMQLRRRRRCAEVAIEDLSPLSDGRTCGAKAEELLGGGSEHWSEARQTRELIRRCIDRLPPIYRAVLWLRDIEARSTCEVAATLELNPNTVKIRLRRARQALKVLLDREGLRAGMLA